MLECYIYLHLRLYGPGVNLKALQMISKDFSWKWHEAVLCNRRRGKRTTQEAEEETPRWEAVCAFALATAHCSWFPVSCPGWSWWVPKGCGQGPWLSGAHFSVLKANRESGHWPASPGGAPEGPGGSRERPLLWEWIFGNASCVCVSDYESKGCISQALWPISGNAS